MKALLFLALAAAAHAGQTYVLTIGLNALDPAAYEGWSGKLAPCENDALFYSRLIADPAAHRQQLLTAAATRNAVEVAIARMAAQAKAGDLVVIGYSGHGTQVPDSNGDEKENNPNDELDEAWCLYDGILVDDRLFALWTKFAAGVDIVVISDSCHAGTMTKNIADEMVVRWNYVAELEKKSAAEKTAGQAKIAGHEKMMSETAAAAMARPMVIDPFEEELEVAAALQDVDPADFKSMPFEENLVFITKQAAALAEDQKDLVGDNAPLQASVFLFASSQDEQSSLAPHKLKYSLFTYFLDSAWANAAFTGSNKALSDQVVKLFPKHILREQRPRNFLLGPKATELALKPAFRLQP